MAADDLGTTVLSISWVFAAVATIVVFARFYVRLRIIQKITVDDCIVAVTLLLALGDSIFLTISTSWGLGQHIESLESQPYHAMYAIKWVYLCEFFSILSPGFGRISFAFMLLNLAPPTKPRRRFLWAIICIQLLVDVVTIIISFTQCRPIQGFWDNTVEADCWPPYVQQYTGYFQGSVCSLVDLILALFPTSLFWNLKMELKQKISLSCIMGLGIFAMIASIVKTINLRAITETADLTYAMANLAIWWTYVTPYIPDAYLVLLAVSIPTLRPIFKNTRPFPHSHNESFRDGNAFHLNGRAQTNGGVANHGSFERLNT